ncbi:Na+/melibiose symporter-like transporter [Promicromonospora iranensis]|uniref:Na+/melibiose symporter-like transporter n=1 Tax=Promicromonospora iranensis TaxID=1105144 RepID=A0ABU2CUU6_9MICO|nr:MFS transporter [Promicromonospora iranensis]MDR7385116.1 Na+/melibiose symporter-like transporter [Promicromonospora iranensis]
MYFTVLTDIPLPVLGAIMSVSVLIGLPLPIATGALVDRWTAHPVVVVGLGIQAVAYAGFVVAREPVEVLLASSVMAVGVRLFWSSVFTFLADYAESGAGLSMEQWFGRLNAVRTVGVVVGGLVTGVVISVQVESAYLALAWAASGCTAVAAVLILAVVKVRPRAGRFTGEETRTYVSILRDREFLRFLALNSVLALSTLFFGLSLPTVVRTGLEGPGWLTAALLVVNALLVAVLSSRGAGLASRFSKVRLLKRAALLWCGAFAAVAVAVTLPLTAAAVVLVIGVALLSTAEILHAPSSAALVDELGRGARGRYLAVFQYSFVVAELVGPIMFTALFDVAAALPFAVVAASCGLVAMMLHRSRRLR